MQSDSLEALRQAQIDSGERYHEFLRVPALSMGIYVLPPGSTDQQQPHDEDEVYVVTRGRARINVAGVDQPVRPGAIVYVPARVAHHFHSIVEELEVLVCFAPAETGTKQT